MTERRVVELFAGCGGSSLGHRLAGNRVVLAAEWDANAVETYRLNFPDTPVFHGDVCALTSERAMELAGVGVGELDILSGSPPCQGFSTANAGGMGKARAVDDPRNRLFEQYVRLLRDFRPRALIMENVAGMVRGEFKRVFREIVAELRACGYRVAVRVLNAKWFGVPQSRERTIFIGFRDDLGVEPSHPKATVTMPITVGQALEGCKVGEMFPMSDRWGSLWRRIAPGKTAKHLLHEIGGTSGFGTIKLDPNRPARTIMKFQGKTGFGTTSHWAEPRSLSTEEAQRLASFPDDFVFVGGYQERWARIGNSVPPNLMRAISAHVGTILDSIR